jgi:hypothetical protein
MAIVECNRTFKRRDKLRGRRSGLAVMPLPHMMKLIASNDNWWGGFAA